jgi:hypothetical protein
MGFRLRSIHAPWYCAVRMQAHETFRYMHSGISHVPARSRIHDRSNTETFANQLVSTGYESSEH